MSPPIGIGAHFQLWGNKPVLIDKLNILVKVGVMQDTVPFSILAEMLSTPVALLQAIDAMEL